MNIQKFNKLNVVGKGGFGKVINLVTKLKGMDNRIKEAKETLCTQINVQSQVNFFITHIEYYPKRACNQ